MKKQKQSTSDAIKYGLLRAIDVSGLGFLDPVVRLCYGEDKDKQIKKIVQFIVIPAITILLFIWAWDPASENITTKSGQLPNPEETLSANKAINKFGAMENDKKRAYEMTGEERLEELAKTEKELAAILPKAEAADAEVKKAKAALEEKIKQDVSGLQADYDKKKYAYKDAQDARKATIETLAAEGTQNNDKVLQLTIENITKTDAEKEDLKVLKADINDVLSQKSDEVKIALRNQTNVAEEKGYLQKKIDLLTKANRSVVLEEYKQDKVELLALFKTQSGKDAVSTAKKIAKIDERIEKAAVTSYAKPATLWAQIKQSIFCVFTGFLIATAIAVPIGILCGLSKTFMAAMTPFIAIFKPVSPIVWLPITLIIVGGFITDPENSPFLDFVNSIVDVITLGQIEFPVNPAFIASAVTVALCSLWATLVNTALGVASIDEDHMNVAKVLKLGFADRLFKIIIPSSLPLIFTGLRISLGVGWMVLIAAELLSSSEGIGKFVWDQFNNGASDSFAKMVVVVFVVGFFGLLLDRIMIVLQRFVSFDDQGASV